MILYWINCCHDPAASNGDFSFLKGQNKNFCIISLDSLRVLDHNLCIHVVSKKNPEIPMTLSDDKLNIQPRRSRSEGLARALRGRIAKGDWVPGAWLPATRDLAENFGVSRRTVQQAMAVLEQDGLVIRRERLGCMVRPIETIEATVAERRDQVGVIRFPDEWGSRSALWTAEIVAGAEQAVLSSGKHLSFISYSFQSEGPLSALRKYLAELTPSLAGLICFPTIFNFVESPKAVTDLFDEFQLPYVLINQCSETVLRNFVGVNYVGGARLTGKCLLALDVRRIVLLTFPLTPFSPESQRVSGLFQSFHVANVPTSDIAVIPCPDWATMQGFDKVKDLIAGGERPQAIVASNDALAIGAMRALEEAGLKVPEDVVVVGGTGLDSSRDVRPSLSVTAQPMYEIGQHAAAMLFEMERAGTNRIPARVLSGDVVLRQSMRVNDRIRDLAASHQDEDAWRLVIENTA